MTVVMCMQQTLEGQDDMPENGFPRLQDGLEASRAASLCRGGS
jgi:hypothetical protein